MNHRKYYVNERTVKNAIDKIVLLAKKYGHDDTIKEIIPSENKRQLHIIIDSFLELQMLESINNEFGHKSYYVFPHSNRQLDIVVRIK